MNFPIEAHSIRVQKTARYYTCGPAQEQVRSVLVVIHGISMLAGDFIQSFTASTPEGLLLVAPEGLSRYYLDRKYERVGAAWMTRVERLAEIEDHVAYLDQMLDELMNALPAHVEVNVLGFSQGCATAWRWVKQGRVQPARLVLWTGTVPEEMDETMAAKLAAARLWGFYGLQDEVIPVERIRPHAQWIGTQAAHLTTHFFDGGHEILPTVLQELWKEW